MIQNHLTSQPLSKRLEKLGVPQKSEFYWIVVNENLSRPIRNLEPMLKYGKDRGGRMENISAFLSSELGEILPDNCEISKPANQTVARDKGKYVVYWTHEDGKYNKIYADTMAESMGLMLEYLILNGLIKL